MANELSLDGKTLWALCGGSVVICSLLFFAGMLVGSNWYAQKVPETKQEMTAPETKPSETKPAAAAPAQTPAAAAAAQAALPEGLADVKQKTDQARAEAERKPKDTQTLKTYREALTAESNAYRAAESKLFAAVGKGGETPPAVEPGQTAARPVVHDPVLFGFAPLRWLIAAALGASVLLLIAQLFQVWFARSRAQKVIQKTEEWFTDLNATTRDLVHQQEANSAATAGLSKEFVGEVYKRLESLSEQIKKAGERGLGKEEPEHGSSAAMPRWNNEQTLSQVAADAADGSADGGPFPAPAQDLIDRIQNRGTVVKPDMHGILIPDSEGWLIVVERANNPDGFYVIPKDTYFQPDVFAVGYKEYFKSNRDAPGQVHIIKPASAVRAGGGWQVVHRGELETT